MPLSTDALSSGTDIKCVIPGELWPTSQRRQVEPVVSKNANQVDIGGRNVGPGWRLGLAPRLIRRTAASTFQRQPMHRLADRPFPSKWPYPPLVLIGSNYTCAFRPPDDDSS